MASRVTRRAAASECLKGCRRSCIVVRPSRGRSGLDGVSPYHSAATHVGGYDSTSHLMAENPRPSLPMTTPSLDQVRAAIRNIPDFPKPGIQFKDITPLLADPQLFAASI